MPKNVTLTRTYVLPRKALKALAPALLAVTRHAKDLENCATYAIRQVLSAYEDGQLKADLHDEQLAVLELANTCIERINEARVVKAHAKAELKSEQDKPAKVLPLLTQSASPFGILDVTVLDNVVRELHSCNEVNAYGSLPGAAAQQSVRKVRGDFQNWLASLKSYKRSPEGFTGRPQMPGYKGKHERAIVKFPWGNLRSGKFVGIDNRALFSDYAQEQALTQNAKAAWLAFELSEAVTALTQAARVLFRTHPLRRPAKHAPKRWKLPLWPWQASAAGMSLSLPARLRCGTRFTPTSMARSTS